MLMLLGVLKVLNACNVESTLIKITIVFQMSMIEDYVNWIESHASNAEDAWDHDHIFALSIDLSFEDEVKMAGYALVDNEHDALDGYQINENQIIFSLPSPNVKLIRNKLGPNWKEEAIVVLGLTDKEV